MCSGVWCVCWKHSCDGAFRGARRECHPEGGEDRGKHCGHLATDCFTHCALSRRCAGWGLPCPGGMARAGASSFAACVSLEVHECGKGGAQVQSAPGWEGRREPRCGTWGTDDPWVPHTRVAVLHANPRRGSQPGQSDYRWLPGGDGGDGDHLLYFQPCLLGRPCPWLCFPWLRFTIQAA